MAMRATSADRQADLQAQAGRDLRCRRRLAALAIGSCLAACGGESPPDDGSEDKPAPPATYAVNVPLIAGASTNSVSALSQDGKVVAGLQGTSAYRWVIDTKQTPTVLPELLPSLPNKPICTPNDMSADGRVIVGSCVGTDGSVQAVRWVDGAITSLGADSEFPNSSATAVSGDGDTIVGCLSASAVTPCSTASWEDGRAFKWTHASGYRTFDELIPDGGSFYVAAFDISDDGKVIVGNVNPGTTGLPYEQSTLGFVYTDLTSAVPAGFIDPDRRWSGYYSVSANGEVVAGYAGSVVVGDNQVIETVIPARWTAVTGLTGIWPLDMAGTAATCMTADGSVMGVEQLFDDGSFSLAMIWDDRLGLLPAQVLFDAAGVGEVVSGGGAESLGGMTTAGTDGETLVVAGTSESNRGFVVQFPRLRY